MNIVECKEFPGFYEIAGFSNYCISKDSRILIKSKNKIINQYKVYGSGTSRKETGYYLRATMYNDDKKLCAVAIHRLMGLTFKRPEGDISKLQVHHIDGIKYHNHIDNLEWVTCKKNIRLARSYYGSRKHIPCQLKHAETGEVFNFGNVSDAAKFIGIHRTTLISRIEKRRDGFVFPEGYAVRYGSSDAEWPLSQEMEEEISLYYSKPLLVKNLVTGTVNEVPTLNDARKYIPYTVGTLCELVNNPTQPSCWGKNGHIYLVIKKYPKKEFRHVTDPYKDLAEQNKHRRLVYAINVVTNEKRLYETTQHCADDFGLLKTTLNWRLKKKVPRVYNDWIFRYFESC